MATSMDGEADERVRQTQKRRRDNVELSFAQRLAGNEKKIRDRAVKKLKQWITARSQKSGSFAEDELMRLWKGLFYCMWMSDKPLVQEELAGKIADLTNSFTNPESALGFFDTCLLTLKREWAGIDYLRIDKFMMMLRKCLNLSLVVLQQEDWKDSLVDQFLQILVKTPLNPDDWVCPSGLRIHVSDIYREELAVVGAEELSSEQVSKLIDPFCVLVTTTNSKSLSLIMLKEFFGEIVTQSDVGMESDSEDEGIQSDNDSDETADEKKKKSSLKGKKKAGGGKGGVDAEVEKEEDGAKMEGKIVPIDKWEEHLADIPRLKFDYSAVADRLLELAGRKEALYQVRRQVYSMIRKLKDLSAGFYPMPNLEVLEAEVTTLERQVDKETDLDVAAKWKQKKDRKKEFRRKKKEGLSKSDKGGEEIEKEEEEETDPEDEEYFKELIKKNKKRKRDQDDKNKKSGQKEEEGNVTELPGSSSETAPKKQKRKKKKKRAGEVKDAETDNVSNVEEKTLSADGEQQGEAGNKTEEPVESEAGVEKKKKPRKRRRKQKNQDGDDGQEDGPGDAKVSKLVVERVGVDEMMTDLVVGKDSEMPKSAKKNKKKKSKSDVQQKNQDGDDGQEDGPGDAKVSKLVVETVSVDEMMNDLVVGKASEITKSAKKNKNKKSKSDVQESDDVQSEIPTQSPVQDISQTDESESQVAQSPVKSSRKSKKTKGRTPPQGDDDQKDSATTEETSALTSPASSAKKAKKRKAKTPSAESKTPTLSSGQDEAAVVVTEGASLETPVSRRTTRRSSESDVANEEAEPKTPTPKSAKKRKSAASPSESKTEAIPTPAEEVVQLADADTPQVASSKLDSSKKKKKRKSKSVGGETFAVSVDQEASATKEDTPKKKDLTPKKKEDTPKKKGETPKKTEDTPKQKEATPKAKEITPVARRTRRKSNIMQTKLAEIEQDDALATTATTPASGAGQKKKSKRKSYTTIIEVDQPDITPVPKTPVSEKKRVKIALNHNEERAPKDYRKRVQKSPGVPFDSTKKPAQSALKFTPPTTRARGKTGSTKKKR